jgi:hypothetical protein
MNTPQRSRGNPTPPDALSYSAPALKPRRTLFYILVLAMLAWMGVLLILYFKTIYPTRANAPAPPVPAQTAPRQ